MQSKLNHDLGFPLISSYVFKLILIIDVLCWGSTVMHSLLVVLIARLIFFQFVIYSVYD